jgi:L-rhamnose mutarotase
MKKYLVFIFLIFFFSFQVQSIEPKDNNQSIFKLIIHEYIRVTMEEYNQPLSQEKREKYKYELSLAYANFLKNWFELNGNDNPRTEDIKFDEAVVIHQNGHKASGIPYDAWFFADIYDVLNEADRNKLWDEVLDLMSGNQGKQEAKVFINLWLKMKSEAQSKNAEKREKSQRWLNRMRKVPLVIEIEKTLKKVDEGFYHKK